MIYTKINGNSEYTDNIKMDKTFLGQGCILDLKFMIKMFQHKENAEMLIGIDEKQAILLIYNHNVGNFRNISSISNTPPPPHTHTLYV